MLRTILFIVNLACTLLVSNLAHAGIVIESTRYLYKEGSREITAQIENKDDMPYLIKSWVETPAGKSPSFLATPPLFRLEAKQQNTVRLFATTKVDAPDDRESLFFFNVMAIPPSDNTYANNNTIQLAVRHRMRLIYRPKSINSLSPNTEAKKLEWRKSGKTITLKNPTPFFYYFNMVKLGNTDINLDVRTISPFSTKKIDIKDINASSISWKIVNDYGGAGSLYSSPL
ncbi:molecular chaperone [Leclercia adecarboxylata]|uniref:fimbrial biogenesis chaperone n=1 Tax=Leclercia TaxID=83654 RepID=UPI000CCFF276|nr:MULTISPECIES: molecular chaperone [Leclercia]POV33116.1 molecular chaperone [Leclercia sp. LSNIH5]POW64925.1 molecular chaperone [Leclercia sp. LSNIH2]AUU83725.1 molecular chaperone [Leclercia sp. LSNIH1]MCZ7838872.1 molecular chaperone [Leclercia adecarboxylata]MEB5750620.1 molecular chaperone [Leclercia adecarboxylata]